MKIWEIIYEGSKIRVENRLCRERLYINNTLQDECSGLGDRSKLIGRLPDGKLIRFGTTEEVKGDASLESVFLRGIQAKLREQAGAE